MHLIFSVFQYLSHPLYNTPTQTHRLQAQGCISSTGALQHIFLLRAPLPFITTTFTIIL